MADMTPRTWKSAAIWLAGAVLLLVVFGWWSGVFQSPPAPSPEAREEMQLDSDEPDQIAPPATQPQTDQQQPY